MQRSDPPLSSPGAVISRRVEEVFNAAIELAPEARALFLNETCGQDMGLRREVESLLEAVGLATKYFDGFAERLGLSAVLEDDFELPQQDLIGPYRLIHLLGRGGMGAVYLAERADEQFDKRVALKLLPAGMGSLEMRRRFLAERQILARLVHPNIARLLDGGVTDQGAPYFVMDYVQGVPIDEYCDAHRLGVAERLALFHKVCDAVEYAHRNLIVHRDLKPGNVLVEDTGDVKLLDFGIAKVLDPSTTSQLTRVGVHPMTPLYASPEMIMGEPVTTAADVYSLGVLLYELLTGRHPYSLGEGSQPEIWRVVCEQDVPPPSVVALDEGKSPTPRTLAERRGTTPERLHQYLRGDLDTIVAMALRKKPLNRYGSVAQLAADLERFQSHLPVVARPPTLSYRTRKFVHRHKALVAAAAVAGILLLAIAGLVTSYTITTKRQSEAIALERDKAEQIRDFLLSIFKVSDPNESKGETVTARELLDRGTERIREELAGQPEAQAMLMSAMAEVYSQLSGFDKAEPLFREALALHRQTYGEISNEYVQVLDLYAQLTEAIGNYDQAESLAKRALSIKRELNEPAGIAWSLNILGRILHLQGQYDAAGAHYREALGIYRSLYGNEHENVALSLSHLGALMAHKEQLDIAEALQREALSIRRKLYGDEHLRLIGSLNNLADLMQEQGNYEEALQLYHEALAINRKFLDEDNRDNAFLLNGLGVIHRRMGNYDEAEANYREAIRIVRKHFGNEHPEVGNYMANLGKLLVVRGDTRSAEPVYREALEIMRKTKPDDPFLFNVQTMLGKCLIDTRDFDEAERLLLTGYEGSQATWGPESVRTQAAIGYLVELYEARNEPGEAARYRQLLSSNTATP